MSSSKRKVKIIDVTPEIAGRWLNLNTHNRPLRNGMVGKYAAAMKAGEWILTAEPIAFSEEYVDANGKNVRETLLNGQHRLWAVVESGCTIPMTVWWNCDPAEFEVIDQGGVRTFGDILNTTRPDLQDHTMIAGVCTSVARYAIGCTNNFAGSVRITHVNLILSALPDSVAAVVKYKKDLRKMAPRPVLSALWLAHVANPTMADLIASQLKDAVGFTEKDPIRALHQYLVNRLTSVSKETDDTLHYKACHALASRLKGEHIKILRITGDGLGWLRDACRPKINGLVQEIHGRVPTHFYRPRLMNLGSSVPVRTLFDQEEVAV